MSILTESNLYSVIYVKKNDDGREELREWVANARSKKDAKEQFEWQYRNENVPKISSVRKKP